jgi:hypothetical protein
LRRNDVGEQYGYEKALQALQKERDYRAQVLKDAQAELQVLQQQANAQEKINSAKTQEPKLAENTAQIQNETTAAIQQIQSYEELCSVVERYNQLVAQGGIKSPTDLDAYADIADQLEGVVPEDKLSKLKTPLDINALAQQLGIELPQAAQQATNAINGVSSAQEHLNQAENQNPKTSDAIQQEAISYDELKRRVEAYYKIRQQMSSSRDMRLTPDLDAAEKDITNLFPETGDGNNITASQVRNMFSNANQNAEHTLKTLANLLGIEIPQAAQTASQAIDGFNADIKETQNVTQRAETTTDTGNTSSTDTSAAKAEAEQQKLENERLKAEKIALQQESDAKLKAEVDSKAKLQTELNAANKQLSDVKEEKRLADANLVKAEESSRAKDGIINGLREQLAQTKTSETKTGGSVKTEELKGILQAITYKVEVVRETKDGGDQTDANNPSLESTLRKVFSNIINSSTQQNDSEQNRSSWALESTLQTAKGVLDNIQTNTSKIGIAEASNVDTIAGTALDSRLTEIKSVLESIDSKIAEGGVSTKKDDGVTKGAKQDDGSKKQTGRASDIKSLTKDYERLAKLSAQYRADGNLETKAMIENLNDEVRIKRKSIGLTFDENNALREKYANAYKAAQRSIDAAKAQKEIDDQRMAADRAAKKQAKDIDDEWKKQVKNAKRVAGINAADSTYRSANDSVIRAIGTEGASSDFENKARELSEQNESLRMLRDEIDKRGEQATKADRDNLSAQISKVKTLKSEVDGYLKLHEKYSGANATQLNVDTSGFGTVGTDQYWDNITAAIKKVSTGRTTIKGLNTDTGELTGTTKIAANTFAEWSATVNPITGKLSMLRTGIKKTEGFMASVARKTKEIFRYFSGMTMVYRVIGMVRQGVQYIKEIDSAMTELRKVTDETEETYKKFLDTAAKTGAKLGATISAVTEATATFAKLGYTMEQATEMAEAAIVYKNVGDNIASTEDAADSIISTLKGFGMEASDAMAIVDRFNEVGNKFAITSQGIGEALRLSASALNEGGNSLDESIAMITAANEVVNDPSSVGTALKTLTLRLRGSKTE